MATAHQILLIAWEAAFALLIGIGLIAWSHVDPAKPGSSFGTTRSGPWVSESILSERGLKWAMARNIATLCFVLCVFADGVVVLIMRS